MYLLEEEITYSQYWYVMDFLRIISVPLKTKRKIWKETSKKKHMKYKLNVKG